MTRSPAMSAAKSTGTVKTRQARGKGRYELLSCGLHGHVLVELQELVENPDETDDLLRLGLLWLASDGTGQIELPWPRWP